MQVIIMRGAAGSGKSTWVSDLKRSIGDLSKVIVCSADDFHYVEGQYIYNAANAGLAHAACLRKFANAVSGVPRELTIIVDNTNTTVWEIAPYYQLAAAYEVPVKIVHVQCSFETAVRRQTHRVPDSTVWRMHQNLMREVLPSHWKEEFVWSDTK